MPRSFGANVEPWLSACSIESNTASKARGENSVAPTGTKPPESAFDTAIKSGSRPQCSHANMRPVRPKPVATSSTQNKVPYRRQSACAPSR